MLGLILQKEGMSRIFKEDGTSTPVTILKLQANVISQIKSSENEGYSSIQISSIDRTEKNVSKSQGRQDGYQLICSTARAHNLESYRYL